MGCGQESETFCSDALEIGVETAQPDAFVFYASQLFLLRDAQGRLDELIPAMEQSVAENPNIAGFRAALAKSYTETAGSTTPAGSSQPTPRRTSRRFPVTWCGARR